MQGRPRADSPPALVAHRIVPGVLGQQVSDCISKLWIPELPLQPGSGFTEGFVTAVPFRILQVHGPAHRSWSWTERSSLRHRRALSPEVAKCWSAWPYIFHQVVQLFLYEAARLSGWEAAILLEAIKPYEEVVVNGLSV